MSPLNLLRICLLWVVAFTSIHAGASPSTFRFSHFNHSSHLVPNQINDLVQDTNGYLWLASTHGLVKFDGLTSQYFKSRAKDDASLSSNTLWNIALDKKGTLWIVTHSGLNSLNTQTGDVTRHPFPPPVTGNQSPPVISKLTLDDQHRLWLATNQGLLQFKTDTEQFVSPFSTNENGAPAKAPVLNLCASDGYLWFTQQGKGLMKLDPDTGELWEIPISAGFFAGEGIPEYATLSAGTNRNLFIGFIGGKLLQYDIASQAFDVVEYAPQVRFAPSDRIEHVLQDDQGDIWISTEQHGLFSIIDEHKSQILPQESDPDSLPTNRVEQVFMDQQHNLWIINSGHGLSLLRQNYKHVGAINKHNKDWQQISDNVVWGLAEDNDARLWVGTNQSGLHMVDFNNKLIRHFVHRPEQPNSLSHNRVLDVYASRKNEIWVSTANGVNRYRQKTDDFMRYFSEPGSPLANTLFSKIFEDGNNNIWIATLGAGAVKIADDGQVSFFNANGEQASIASDYVTAFAEDKRGQLWIGTRKGISIYSPDSARFERLLPESEIWSLYYDPRRDNVIVGTSHGAARVSADGQHTTWLTSQQGLAGNRVYCIEADDEHYYLSTDIGLTQWAVSGQTKNAYWFDGFQSGYNLNGCATGKSGRLYFSGNKGVSYFQPESLEWMPFTPSANVTSVMGYDDTQGGYQKPIGTHDDIRLSYDENNLRFHFSGIYFKFTEGLTLRYRLVGLNDTWTTEQRKNSGSSGHIIASRFATYTNLSPGSYRFEVQYDAVGSSPSEIAAFSFTIAAPWWNNIWAWLIYLCALTASVYLYTRWRITSLRKEKVKLTQLVQERTHSLEKMADKAVRLSEQKKHLFANVSHEFKTPLTLIMSPVDAMLEQTTDSEQTRKLQGIRRQTARLEHMVNQMLELSALDSHPHFDRHTYDADEVINDMAVSFNDVARHHSMTIEITAKCGARLHIIEDSLHKILLNLLSNAIKYGRPHTRIKTGAKITPSSFECWVEDQGPGFDQEQAKIIRDRFCRLENTSSAIPGSGLGLSIVSELVEANQGSLSVDSVPGKGSRFLFTFPVSCLVKDAPQHSPWAQHLTNQYLEELRFVPVAEDLNQTQSEGKQTPNEPVINQPRVLIVEDNLEIGTLISGLLTSDYQCHFVQDGQKALQVARQTQPELIISDVMMPNLDGYAMTQALKQDDTTCHIPILLISAKSDIGSRLQGLKLEADDYMGKPFHSEELRLKVTNLINTRARLRVNMATGIGLHRVTESDGYSDIHSRDQKFIEKFETLINDHFSDESLNRSTIAEKMAMSERNLNRKLAAIFGHNFTEYLRKFRLRKSLGLAGKGLQTAQVSDMVGFANATYFSTCFKNEFKLTFKQYERQQEGKDSS